MRLAHFILTRFNLAPPGERGPDASWLSHRMELFRTFCAPSVLGQSCREFRWLVFVDPSTPDPYRRDLQAAIAPLGSVHDALGFSAASAAAVVRGAANHRATHVLTTTLDNDDALAVDFVRTLQGACRPRDFELLNVVRGLRLLHRSGRLYACELETNPFVSVLERADGAKTIWECLPHSTISSRFTGVRNLETPPLWLQVVHGRNVASTGAWGLRRVRRAELSRFRLEWRASDRERGIALENVVRRAERALIRLVPAQSRARVREAVRGHILGCWRA